MTTPTPPPTPPPTRSAARPPEPDLTIEDRKLFTLARSARARIGAPQGAACRDLDGRTYAAGAVALPGLDLSAVQVCVAMAVTSGARGLEAMLVFGGAPTDDDVALVTHFGGDGVVLHRL